MKKLINLCLFTLFLVTNAISQTAGIEVYINEIHYDNTGTDVGEGVEIAGPAGTDLSTFMLTFYNGADSSSYSILPLTGIIPDELNGYGTLCFSEAGIQNGSPDGIALSDALLNIQFLSYEGFFMALDGVAVGMISTDIGVVESGSTPIGESMQLSGTGTVYSDFTWNSPTSATPCSMNSSQTFGVNCSSSASFSDVACESYTSPSGNYTWTTTGIYMDTIPNAALCDSVLTIDLTINQLPSVTYSEPVTSICVYNSLFTLSGTSPVGGIFSGNGVSGSDFDPSAAGTGSHIITYSYTDANGCTNSDSSLISVGDESFASVTEVSCESYNSPSGNYTWTISGIYMDTIQNATNCDSVITIDLTINPLPTVSYTETNNLVCISDNPFSLSGQSPAGGAFSGPGVIGSNFNPSVAGIGTHDIIYSYTDGNNCTNSDTSAITVESCAGLLNLSINFVTYPNPTKEYLTIEQPESSPLTIKLYTLNGLIVKSLETEAQKVILDLTKVARGTYFMKLMKDSSTTTKIIVVE